MLDKLKSLFGTAPLEKSALDIEVEVDRVYPATCAILLELANIDGEFSDTERDHIIAVFKDDYHLPEEDILELIAASEKELKESIDLWQFTNLINQNFSLEEKIRIMETVWKVAYSDGSLDENEDYLAHKVANLLRLNHKQLIDAKLKMLHSDDK
jgi:uncharacterized tellurite resistance protein B-like protein